MSRGCHGGIRSAATPLGSSSAWREAPRRTRQSPAAGPRTGRANWFEAENTYTRSSSRENRIRVPGFVPVVYFSRGTLVTEALCQGILVCL